MLALQGTLTGWREAAISGRPWRPERTALGRGAWIELARGWLEGDVTLFDQLHRDTFWHADRRPMYDRMVDVPRLTARLPRDGPVPPVLLAARDLLTTCYDQQFSNFGLALYRDGSDSVAPHGDMIAREMNTSVMATISLGAPRRLLLSPEGGGPSHGLDLGAGDLLVMGGTIQRTWRHSVPKTTRPVGPRISVMLRPTWRSAAAVAEGGRDVYS